MTTAVKPKKAEAKAAEVKIMEKEPVTETTPHKVAEPKTKRKRKSKAAETKTDPEEKTISQDVKNLNEIQKKKSGLGFSDYLKYGTHCVLAVTERSLQRLMNTYKNIFILDQKMDFTYWKDQGFNAFSSGKYDNAINLFKTCLDKGANHDIEVLFYMGLSHVNSENYDKGLEYLKRAETHDGDDLDIISEIGHCLIKLENYAEAINYYKKAILINPGEVNYFYMRGTAYEKNGQFDQAIEMYRRSIDLDPRNPLYYHALGFVFESINKHNDAIACFKKAMELEKER